MIELVLRRATEISAPADVVWDVVADFGSLGDWWPDELLEKVEIEGAGIGMVRALHTVIGIVLRERLEALDPDEMRIEISIEGDLPVGIRDYHEVGLVSAKGRDACTVEWTGYCRVPDRASESGAREFIEGTYRIMFKAIRDHVLKDRRRSKCRD